MNKVIIALVVIVLAVLAGFYFLSDRTAPAVETSPANGEQETMMKEKETVMEKDEAAGGEEKMMEDGMMEDKMSMEVKVVNLVSKNFSFEPSVIRVKKGQPLKIMVSNQGTHTFTIDELGINAPLRNSQEVIEFTPDTVGTFEFYCSVASHRQLGQVGTLIVEE